MILKPDCIRDILLAVEACPFSEYLNLDKLDAMLPDHSYDDIWYTCLKLEEGGYLSLMTVTVSMSYRPGIKCIIDLTYQGHEFLNSVRDPKRWQKLKCVAEGVKDYSLSALQSIAEGMTSAAISTTLQSYLPL